MDVYNDTMTLKVTYMGNMRMRCLNKKKYNALEDTREMAWNIVNNFTKMNERLR